MALPVNSISPSDKLESGFRAKANGNFNSIVVESEIDAEGKLLLKSPNGNITTPLGDFFASKLYVGEVAVTPPASETVAGRAKIATDVQAIEGTSDSTIITPLKLTQKLTDYFSNLTSIGDAVEEFQIGGDSTALTKIKGKLDLYGNQFFDNSLLAEIDPNQEFSLGLSTQLFYTDGEIRAAGGVKAFGGLIHVTAERLNPDDETLEPQAMIIADATPLYLKTAKVNIMSDLASNVYGAYSGNSIMAKDNWTFQNPVLIVDGLNPQSAVSKQLLYATVGAVANGGYRPYGFVYCATTTNITLSGSQVCDGITPPNGAKVLVQKQTDKKQNGIYFCNDSGAWTRVSDFLVDGYGKVMVSVNTGTTLNSSVFVCEQSGVITIGTTEITFIMTQQTFAAPYLAYRIDGGSAGPQHFSGTHIFDNKLKAQTPTDDDDVTTKFYVTGQLSTLNTSLLGSITSSLAGYYAKLSSDQYTNGIGQTSNNDLNIITNNIKRATFSKNGGLELLGYGQFRGGIDITGQLLTGYHGGTSASSYNVDIVRGGSTSRAALRFANYISGAGAGATNQVKRGIEFDADNNLIIGTYDSNFTVFEKTFNSAKSTIFKEDGKVGFGVTPTERVDIYGNLKVSGVYKPAGNAPTADAQFLVSDGTTANKYINFGEFGQFQAHDGIANISSAKWGANFVKGTTTGLPNDVLQGHVVKMSIGSEYPDQATYLSIGRPFGSYFDGKIYVRGVYGSTDSGWLGVGGDSMQNFEEELGEATIKTRGYFYEVEEGDKHGFFGINQLEGGFEMNLQVSNVENSNISFYGTKMSAEDGRLYFREGDNEPRKYALIDEVGTGGSGTAYTLASPLYFSDSIPNQINARYANSTRDGVISADDFIAFSEVANKIEDGNELATGFTFKHGSKIKFQSNASSTPTGLDAQIYTTGGSSFDSDLIITTGLNGEGQGRNIKLLAYQKVIIRQDADVSSGSGVVYAEVELAQAAQTSGIKMNGTMVNMYLASMPSNGQKMVLQYSSTTNSFTLVNA